MTVAAGRAGDQPGAPADLGRRTLLAGLGAGVAVQLLELAGAPGRGGSRLASAQAPGRSALIGVLGPPPTTEPGASGAAVLRAALAELGWREGAGLRVEERFAESPRQALSLLATELSRLGVEVVVALGPEAAMAARAVSRTAAVVMVGVGDPVTTGVVPSPPARRTNVTVLELPTAELMDRRLALLREAVPAAARIGLLFVRSPRTGVSVRHAEAAGARLGLATPRVTPRRVEDLAVELRRAGADAVLGVTNLALDAVRREVIEALRAERLPALFDSGGWAEAGALLSYAPDQAALQRQAAASVDRLLRGEKAADLPIETATRFELVANKAAAGALGLTLPAGLLARATRVIE